MVWSWTRGSSPIKIDSIDDWWRLSEVEARGFPRSYSLERAVLSPGRHYCLWLYLFQLSFNSRQFSSLLFGEVGNHRFTLLLLLAYMEFILSYLLIYRFRSVINVQMLNMKEMVISSLLILRRACKIGKYPFKVCI